MRKKFSGLSSIAAFVIVGLSAQPAKADCCNDFLSCAGAFFSGGVSCAVEAAHNEINNFVQRVERTKRQGEQQMQATTRSLDQEAQNACGAEDRVTNDRLVQVNAATSSAASTVNARAKKGPPAVEASLTAGLNKLKAIQSEASLAKTESASKLSQASAARQAKIQALNATFHATFVAPLAGLVAPLIAALDPISAVATIAVLADKLGEIERETERAIARGVDEFDGALQGFMQDLRAKREAQEKRAEQAKMLADTINALAQSPTEENRRRLDTLVTGKEPPRMVTIGKAARLQLQGVALSKANALPALKQALKADADFARGVKAKPVVNFNKTAAEQNTRQGLEARLAGKTGAALEDEKKKLLAEARARFAKDEKTLALVEKGILDEIDKRKQLKAKLAPAKPIPGAPPIRN